MADELPLFPDIAPIPRTRRTRARRESGTLVRPRRNANPDHPGRDEWIEQTCAGFVSPSEANKEYYRAVLECLWPPGHGIPGPHISRAEIREAIDSHRRAAHQGPEPYKPYRDPFRRVRELQGEEGVIGIIKQGQTYQLQSLELMDKREPRTGLSNEQWEQVLTRYDHKCAVCGRTEPEVRFDQDHKVPRMRGGGNELDNWMPLCVECNNHKSTACRVCSVDCETCPWAYPEKYLPLRLSGQNIQELRRRANKLNVDPDQLANEVIEAYLREQAP